ncbi:hypothetical protein hamaS1_17740 [Moorella sp. Hama-1]|nr:hypothetical protein hamaS1_17740 [Moorella sp. Hama-1]
MAAAGGYIVHRPPGHLPGHISLAFAPAGITVTAIKVTGISYA